MPDLIRAVTPRHRGLAALRYRGEHRPAPGRLTVDDAKRKAELPDNMTLIDGREFYVWTGIVRIPPAWAPESATFTIAPPGGVATIPALVGPPAVADA